MRGTSYLLSLAALLTFAVLVRPAFALPHPVQMVQPAHHVEGVNTRGVIPSSALIQPAVLAKLLHTANPPMVLQVGFHIMYEEAHIPGAEYAGPARTASGLEVLRKQVSGVKKDQPIVIYCGCCPWPHCPNIRPAYKALKELGFKDVKALYLANNFGTDWVHKGYPVEGTVR